MQSLRRKRMMNKQEEKERIKRIFLDKLSYDEENLVHLFAEMAEKHKSAHPSETPDYASELQAYLHLKASAETKGEHFEEEPDTERHISGCVACKELYIVLKKAAPVLDKVGMELDGKKR